MAKPTRLPSRPGEFHPEPLTNQDRILSHHPARAIARRLPPSTEQRAPPCEAVGPPPSLQPHYRTFVANARQSAPLRRIGTSGRAFLHGQDPNRTCTGSSRLSQGKENCPKGHTYRRGAKWSWPMTQPQSGFESPGKRPPQEDDVFIWSCRKCIVRNLTLLQYAKRISFALDGAT